MRKEGNVLFIDAFKTFYLRLYGIRHMVKDHLDSERGKRCRHIGYSFWLTVRVILYAPSHRQDSTYCALCYTSRGALAGTRYSSMGPPHEGYIRRLIAPWANVLTTELHLAPHLQCFSIFQSKCQTSTKGLVNALMKLAGFSTSNKVKNHWQLGMRDQTMYLSYVVRPNTYRNERPNNVFVVRGST